jgi:filamentous hemagglutinin family protein
LRAEFMRKSVRRAPATIRLSIPEGQLIFRAALLAGVSALTLLSAAAPAEARNILAGGGGNSAVNVATAAATASAQQAAQAAMRAQNSLSRATQTLQAMQAAQSAAHNLSLQAPSAVANGLAPGGLVPVANPNSTTDGLTDWIGATAPVQSAGANGQVDVAVKQTQSSAILSWNSFNLGPKTTLTFDQQGNASWIALNRVVGNTAPSQILGQIKADGTVLVINQNGIIFGGGAQINVNSLIASTLDIGRAIDLASRTILSVAQRDQEFLTYGLLGYADTNGINVGSTIPNSTLSTAPGLITGTGVSPVYHSSGSIQVENGAQIASGDGGYILLAAPTIENAGHLSAVDGQVILAAGDNLTLMRATGAADSVAPGIRGFLALPGTLTESLKSVVNDATGLIESPRGSIFLDASNGGATVNAGGLFATSSVSRNGAIEVSGSNIEIALGSIIAITPDTDGETIPQDSTSVADFKPSEITIGNLNSRLISQPDSSALIDIGANAFVYAPSGNITIGAGPGATANMGTAATSRVFVDSGAVIDASGLKDVLIPASRNEITILPVTANDLADDPNYQGGFLSGMTVTVDPRLSGVRSDGVAWIGSPLINATSYYQQVGVSAAELMTKGGNVTLGVGSYAGTGAATTAPNVIVKAGAIVDVSGGWVTYQAGQVHTTQLVDASGHIIDIGHADPSDIYIGIYAGFTVNHPHWGIVETYANSIHSGSYYQPQYSEGRDAGSLTVKGSAAAIDGTVYAQAFPGEEQLLNGDAGTGTSTVYGDERAVQAAPSQLPAGGFLFIQAQAQLVSGGVAVPNSYAGGGDILVQSGADYVPQTTNLDYGQTVQATPGTGDTLGALTIPTRDPASQLTPGQLGTIALSDRLLSNSGFSQVSLHTSGAVTVESNANVNLSPGGVFDILAGHRITIDGTVSAPSGNISLVTFDSRLISTGGSVFSTTPTVAGDFDIVVNGTLSVRGRWVNDFGLDSASIEGGAWLDGGSITLYAAPRVSDITSVPSGAAPATSTDLSGSILIDSGSLIDVSGGGRIDQNGKLDLLAHGGNLSLYDETSYFQIAKWENNGLAGSLSGFRINGLVYANALGGDVNYVPVNPDQINARVSIDPGAIKAQGFAGGGTFTLTTPEFAFSDDASSTASANATTLPLSFFSSAGFANYKITSYKTDLIANPFDNGLGGTDAVLATQTLTVGNGQNLALTQSMLPSVLNAAQNVALFNLASGGDLFSVLSPLVPADAWGRKGVNLTFGGLLELHVAQGGSITGDAGSSLTVSGLLNEGTIHLPGGSITQQTILPTLYTQSGVLGIHALSDIFTTNPDGSINENAASIFDANLTNAQLVGANSPNATPHPIYLLGILDAGEGIELAPGSVTDLSGTSIRNPYAAVGVQSIATGRMIAGGTLATLSDGALVGETLFQPALGSVYQLLSPSLGTKNGISQTPLDVVQAGRSMVLDAGSTLNLSGASDTYDQLTTGSTVSLASQHYASAAVWSDAGTLYAGAGLTLTGAAILAQGGASQANGGTLVALDPVLAQHDPVTRSSNIISADMISGAGFDTLVALGSVGNLGDATVMLGRAFFLETRPFINNGNTLGSNIDTSAPNSFVPTLRSTGGTLTVDAPYVSFDSAFDEISTPAIGSGGGGSIVFNASVIDFTGAILVDRSVASATFNASGDIRLTGVVPWQQTFIPGSTPVPTLNGLIAASGNLTFNAGQLYPTTGSIFSITSSAANGTITFGRSGSATPDAPHSAGGDLTVQAANIIQGGVIRVPLGTLTLGDTVADIISGVSFAPATQSVVLTGGGITSVSADGLVIPYGTTTDQTEWFFAPTNADPLSAPPSKLLNLSGANVAISAGATVDLTGGGDIYAYEFVPGTGGSRDVLDRLNPDPFTSTTGTQYPEGRQIYAIVPGLSNAPVAAYDPIYSADYSNLTSVAGAGSRVWLDGGKGLAAGWYTLLPAQYAMLPGGMRVVEQTGASGIVAGLSGTLADGAITTTGSYGNATAGSAQSQVRLFEVQSQAVIKKESNIAITTGNSYFAALAAHGGVAVPQLPIDAARLVIDPGASLVVDTILSTAAAPGGRGAQVDIAGTNIDVLARLSGVAADGAVHLTATSLTNLNADSLLIGGTRTDNADGTTTLSVAAQNLLVDNDATAPLSAGEVLLAATANLTVMDSAAIVATGTLSDTRTGAYQIGSTTISGTGALLRVANGPERLVDRTNSTTAATLAVGAATLSGTAVMFDSSGANTLSSGLVINNAQFVAVGAPRIGFGADPATYNGLVITDTLKNLLSQGGAQLTLRSQSSIDFAGGDYSFGNIRFDAGALSSLDGGDVIIRGNTVGFGNAGAAGAVCTTCTGTLSIDAGEIVFTGGATVTSFGAVTLSATGGILVQGTGSALQVGAAPLTIHTPYIGDQAVALATGIDATIPDLTLTTTSAMVIDNAGAGAMPTIAGIPGSAVTISGQSVSISGTTINATAGKVQINSATGITLADGATIEAPGYTKIFGDSVDPVNQNAPGGSVALAAQSGDITLGNATLSVGGGSGDAGTLTLSAVNGSVNFGTATLNGTGGAGGQGGSFAIETLGAVDFVALNNRVGAQGFTGGFTVHTSTGDLTLAAGQTLISGSVDLTADGGFVDVAGTIDTSGINGGDVSLYGRSGVTLTDTARINAYATGYSASDTRQAKAGNVTLDTDFTSSTTSQDGSISGVSGAISVAGGAIIDVSARRPGARLVPIVSNGVTNYSVAQGDQGGIVTLRAPVVNSGGSNIVNVSVANAGSIVGASAVDFVGFKRWDLAAVAASGLYTGVTLSGNTITLDVSAGLDTANTDGTLTAVAGLNFLGDKTDGTAATLVDFVQGFNVSASYGNLGGLSTQSNFHAKPGIDLTYTGDITLASNWNLGAGIVNQDAAVAAGVMETQGSQTYVVSGVRPNFWLPTPNSYIARAA